MNQTCQGRKLLNICFTWYTIYIYIYIYIYVLQSMANKIIEPIIKYLSGSSMNQYLDPQRTKPTMNHQSENLLGWFNFLVLLSSYTHLKRKFKNILLLPCIVYSKFFNLDKHVKGDLLTQKFLNKKFCEYPNII
jgi:hypothetical protein